MVDNQKPPPMLCTPKVLPRRSSIESIPFLTINSRGILLLPTAKQPSFMPPTVALKALLGAAQTKGAPPDASVAIMIGPLRVCSTLGSSPCFLNKPFSMPTHSGAIVSLWPP